MATETTYVPPPDLAGQECAFYDGEGAMCTLLLTGYTKWKMLFQDATDGAEYEVSRTHGFIFPPEEEIHANAGKRWKLDDGDYATISRRLSAILPMF